jgi:hypothetical protein
VVLPALNSRHTEKHLVRTMHELAIVTDQEYIAIETILIEISKMTNGWIKYIHGGAE